MGSWWMGGGICVSGLFYAQNMARITEFKKVYIIYKLKGLQVQYLNMLTDKKKSLNSLD
jgi:hypothetical protein